MSQLLNAAEDRFMPNIPEECLEYGIIFKDRDQWWARKEINGERNQNRSEKREESWKLREFGGG